MTVSNITDTYHKFLATGMGFGLSPFAPGTCGALLAVVTLYPISLSSMPNVWLLGLSVLFYGLGVQSTSYLEPQWGEDPSRVVIDEVIGIWISILLIPISWVTVVLAFVLFRFFDILKPLGIRKMEHIGGAHGVMLDDVLAGIYSNIVLQLIYHFVFQE